MQVRSDPVTSSQMRIGFANIEGLKLLKGEIVQAVVEKFIGDGRYQVHIKGMTVEAATELMLTPGQSLLLRSEGSADGRQILRVVKPGEEYSLKVATILQEMGFKADDRLIAVTAKLMQYSLPITRENIDYVMTATRWLGGFNSLNLETAAWTLASGIKANPEILNAIRSFLQKPESINAIISQIIQSLSATQSTAEEGLTANQHLLTQPTPNRPPQATNITAASRMHSGEAAIEADDVPAINRYAVSGTANRLEVASAMNRLDGIDTPNRIEGNNIISNPGNGITENAFLNRRQIIEGLFKAIELLVNLKVTGDPETITENLQKVMASNKEVIRALAVIQEILTQFPDTARQVGNEVLQLVQSAEGELIGQAAFNSAERQASNQQPGFYYLAIPMEFGGKDRVMELKIYKDDRGTRRLDEMEEIRLAVSLDTANLGMVVFHVTARRDNMLEIQGVVNNLVSKEVIENSIDLLQQRLMEHGYRVHFWGMKLTSEPEKLRPRFQSREMESPVLGIDITV